MEIPRSWPKAIAAGWAVAYLAEFFIMPLQFGEVPGNLVVFWLMSILIGTIPGLVVALIIEAITRPLRRQWVTVLGYAIGFGALCVLVSQTAVIMVALPVVIGRIAAAPLVPLPEQR